MDFVNGTISGTIYINNAVSNMILAGIIVVCVSISIPIFILVTVIQRKCKKSG